MTTSTVTKLDLTSEEISPSMPKPRPIAFPSYSSDDSTDGGSSLSSSSSSSSSCCGSDEEDGPTSPMFPKPSVHTLYQERSVNHGGEKTSCYVGVSLGVSPLASMEYAIPTFDYALEKYDRVVVLVTDTLAQFNWAAFHGKSVASGNARKLAVKEGQKYRDVAAECQNLLPHGTRLEVIGWDDMHDDEYQHDIDVVKHEFQSNTSFQSCIREVALAFATARNPNFNVNSKKMNAVIDYVLWELPILLKGLFYQGSHFPSLVYPAFHKTAAAPASDQSSDPMAKLLALMHRIWSEESYTKLRTSLRIAADGDAGSNASPVIDLVFYEPPQKHPKPKHKSEAPSACEESNKMHSSTTLAMDVRAMTAPELEVSP